MVLKHRLGRAATQGIPPWFLFETPVHRTLKHRQGVAEMSRREWFGEVKEDGIRGRRRHGLGWIWGRAGGATAVHLQFARVAGFWRGRANETLAGMAAGHTV